jgi:osmoprotectant transport system substrate-binding protein
VKLTRARALGWLACTPLIAACGSRADVRVGSKNFTESFIIAEIYAQALEGSGLRVERKFGLGSTAIALAAMQRGDIDLYPEYTGTALIDVLHLPPSGDSAETYEIVAREFANRYDFVWLHPSPMNNSQGLATTAPIARRERLQTLSDLGPKAAHLRLATIQEFLSRPDGLPGLQRVYGGFKFREVRTYDIALKYQALLAGSADVATAFTTDGAIATYNLVVLRDDRHLWPPYNVAPVVRGQAIANEPRIALALNRIAPEITDRAAQTMNAKVERDHLDPADVASAFLKSTGR